MTATPYDQPRRRHPAGWLPFIRHYLEMVLAMAIGMIALMPLEMWALQAVGAPHVLDRVELMTLVMATDMAIAMGAWMAYRRHGWNLVQQICWILSPAPTGRSDGSGRCGLAGKVAAVSVVVCLLPVLVRALRGKRRRPGLRTASWSRMPSVSATPIVPVGSRGLVPYAPGFRDHGPLGSGYLAAQLKAVRR